MDIVREADSARTTAWQRFEDNLKRNDGEGARRALALAVQHEAEPADAYFRIAQAASRTGHAGLALEYALKAAAPPPSDPERTARLALQLQKLGETRTASRLCLAIDTDDPALLFLLAGILKIPGNLAEAHGLLSRAMSKGLDDAASHKLMAIISSYLGRNEQAEAEFRKALDSKGEPLLATPLSRLRRSTPTDNDIERFTTLLAGCRRESPAYSDLAFALFKQLDDIGAHEEAWRVLADGAAAKRATIGHDPARHALLIDRLIAMPAESIRRTPDPGRSPLPIFVVGLPRSGSTLIERLLSNHSQVASAGELGDFSIQAYLLCDLMPNSHCSHAFLDRADAIDRAELGRRYLAHAQYRAEGLPWFIDKQPLNYLHVPLIRQALPDAKIILATRDPVANCFSLFKFLFARDHHYSYELGELASYHREYRRLMQHWLEAYGDAILEVRYEHVLIDPEAELARMFGFCGLPHESGCGDLRRNAAPVATGSASQVRDGISGTYAERWLPYADKLEPLIRPLGET